MSKKCKFCFTKHSEQEEVCSVCKIPFNKIAQDLTVDERRIWHAARNLRIVSFFMIFAGFLTSLTSIVILSLFDVIKMSIGIFVMTLGYALRSYKKWSYVGGIIFCSLVFLLYLVTMKLIPVLFCGLFLYIISNPTAKKILYREVK